MIRNNKKKNTDDISSKLDTFLNKTKDATCDGEECLINNQEEIVKREHKKIITSDGRQLLSEYTN